MCELHGTGKTVSKVAIVSCGYDVVAVRSYNGYERHDRDSSYKTVTMVTVVVTTSYLSQRLTTRHNGYGGFTTVTLITTLYHIAVTTN